MAELTIIIPAYNEELALRETIETLTPIALRNNWDILVVNDGSTDRTAVILAGIPGIRFISHTYNKGYGASLKTGINAASSPLIAFYDADGQHRPTDVEEMMRYFKSHNCDMLVGERGKDSHRDWLRRPGKWLLAKVANYLAEHKIPDLNSGLRIIKREIMIPLLHLFPNGFSFSTTSTIAFFNLGFSVDYYPIKVNKRIGKSSVKQFKHGTTVILLMIRLILLFNPLKIFLPVSLYLFIIGMLYEIIWGIFLIPNNVRLIPAAFFTILTSILVFFFGLVVDQISELRKHLSLKSFDKSEVPRVIETASLSADKNPNRELGV